MAMILNALSSKIMVMVTELMKDEVHMLLGVPDEIDKLHDTLRLINGVLSDAERKGAEERSLEYLLRQLKDVMYDVDDILDDCRIEASKSSSTTKLSASSGANRLSVSCGFPCVLVSCFRKVKLSHQTGKRIASLNHRLDEIWKGLEKFQLVRNVSPFGGGGGAAADEHRHGQKMSSKRSSVMESDIVGSKIEEDTQSLIKLLTKPEDNQTRPMNLLVFAIVGIGGIGKTTLAQKIFADQNIKDNFTVKMWVCVSREYTAVGVLRDVITSAGASHGGAETGLEEMIVNIVRGRKFFLVLDDVWEAQVWEEFLRNPLSSGAAGSRVLITTRNEEVAMKMKAVRPYHRVDLLSPEDGWLLLCKKVTSEGEDGEEVGGLKDIGIKIVEKCDGLPLAIKTLGGVLCGKRRRSDWESVLGNTAWSVTGLPDGISNALYLSYLDLPTHLRQCLLYCSLFPKDRVIHRLTIVKLWIAEGFVKADQSVSMEEVGEGYYRDLILRNLLQPDPYWYDQSGSKMHDLLVSLCQFLAQDESLVLGEVQSPSNSTSRIKLRRLSVVGGEAEAIPKFLNDQGSLRSLLLYFDNIYHLNDLPNQLNRLRVLDLSGTRIRELPEDFLGRQVHLRYLNLSQTPIRKIPETIKNLKNLEFLILRSCENLYDLPNGIIDLHNLRSLDLLGTEVEGMPVGLGKLQDLNVLQGFMLHGDTSRWCNLVELRSLSHLRFLTIGKLEKASSLFEARAAALVNKPRLTDLQLSCSLDGWGSSGPDTKKIEGVFEELPLSCTLDGWLDSANMDGWGSSGPDTKKIEEVFEELQPPHCLEDLSIHGYFGSQFPSWLMSGASKLSLVLPNLTRLVLEDCTHAIQLPPLGLLPNLDFLWIKGANMVFRIGHEFLGVRAGEGSAAQSSTSFPKLERLGLQNMHSWFDWQWDMQFRSMPRLKTLELNNCPELMLLPEGLPQFATALTELYISGASKLSAVEKVISLESLDIVDSPRLERVTDLPALKSLYIESCPRLQVVDNLLLLQNMKLFDYKMDSLPKWLSEGVHKAKPEKLEIQCNEELFKNICLRAEGQEWHKIQHIDRVSIYSEDGSRAYYNKTPFSFIINLSIKT